MPINDRYSLSFLSKLLGLTLLAYWFCYELIDPMLAYLVFHYCPSLIQNASYLIDLPFTPIIWVALGVLGLVGLTIYKRSHYELNINPKPWHLLATSLVAAGFICEILKIILGRARPELWFAHTFYGFYGFSLSHAYNSTPSGHATIVFVLATVISLVRPSWQILGWTIAIIVGITRILLNQHYLGDVLLGAYLGWATTYIIAQYYEA